LSHFKFKTQLINKAKKNTQTAELLFAVKSILAKLAVNADFFTARLEAQKSSKSTM
jgi:hypothetical protein